MIYISTTQSLPIRTTSVQNRIVLATNSFYTWVLNSSDNLREYVFAPDDFSTSAYYSAFTISTAFPSPPGGYSETASVVLNLQPGEYRYRIHQTEFQYDLGLTSSYGVIEEGILISLGTYSPPNYYTASNDDIIRVFRGS